MWSFLSRRVRKARVRAAFSDFVSKEALREIEESLENPNNELPPLQSAAIHYVILQVREDSLEDVQRRLGRTLDLVVGNSGIVETMLSTIAVVTFELATVTEQSLNLLLGKLGPDVKAVYGYGEFPRGMYGSRYRFAYGTIFPHLDIKLEALRQTEYGTSRKI